MFDGSEKGIFSSFGPLSFRALEIGRCWKYCAVSWGRVDDFLGEKAYRLLHRFLLAVADAVAHDCVIRLGEETSRGTEDVAYRGAVGREGICSIQIREHEDKFRDL